MAGRNNNWLTNDNFNWNVSKQNLKNDITNSELEHFLSSILLDANSRDIDLIKDRIESLRGEINSEILGSIEPIFGGSISKNTHINGLSDVDVLFRINDTELESKSTIEVKDFFLQKLKDGLKQDASCSIIPGSQSITITFKDGMEIQMLPAIQLSNDKFKIPNENGNDWIQINPVKFRNKLSSINNQQGMNVVPVIKLAKQIISSQSSLNMLNGYHCESMAIEAFKNYNGTKSRMELLKHYFRNASELVTKPILDSTGQSRHVDDYLPNDTTFRRNISSSLTRISSRLENCTSKEELNDLLNGY